VSTINAALTAPPNLPPDLADELAVMHLFSDDALWAAVQPSLSPAEQHRLRQLNHLAGERPLTQAEASEQAVLLRAYHRSVLRRAQALAILGQRGHPVPREDLPPAPFEVSLFHPRQQHWHEHFAWSEDGTQIIGLTSCGRATIEALQLNHSLIVATRTIWVQTGYHPSGLPGDSAETVSSD